jgi:hypothetical protein
VTRRETRSRAGGYGVTEASLEGWIRDASLNVFPSLRGKIDDGPVRSVFRERPELETTDSSVNAAGEGAVSQYRNQGVGFRRGAVEVFDLADLDTTSSDQRLDLRAN